MLSELSDGWVWVSVPVLFAALVLWGVYRAGQWLLWRERAAGDALGAVMAATVLRRDREQTLGLILARSVEVLGATSGTLHLPNGSENGLRLAQAVNIVHLDQLARLSPTDPLWSRVREAQEVVCLETAKLGTPWWAVAAGSSVLVAIPLGGGSVGMLTLAWPSRRAAEACLTSVAAIHRYTDQVQAEFEELEARAAEIQSLSDSLYHHEVLTRTAAHDLANKLAAAQSVLDLLADADGLAADTAVLLMQAGDQLRLSQPLLDELSNPDRALQREVLEIEALVELASAMLGRLRRGRPFEVTLDVAPALPAVWGERLAILRVLDNLFSNALKHNAGQMDLRVWLRVWAEEECVVCEIADNGGGIAPEAQARLFDFGYRADSTGKVKGHGLGLWSSRRLVAAMGGRIWVESEPGAGARFRFTLRRADTLCERVDASGLRAELEVPAVRAAEAAEYHGHLP